MEAKVVDYKICDMDFNCDSCAFHSRLTGHKQLKNESHKSDFIPSVNISIPNPDSAYFHPGIQYYEDHCWIKHISKNTVLIGLDYFFLNLWCDVKSVLLSTPGTKLNEKSSFCWIALPYGLVCLKIPFTAQVLEVNNQVHELDFNDFCNLEWENHWFLKLNIDDDKLVRTKWLTKQQYLNLLNKDSLAINNLIKDHSTLQNYGTIASGGMVIGEKNQNMITIPKDLFSSTIKQIFNNNHLFI
ncbi:hypothetical protein ACFL46_05760 [Candidatus Neomarinimicrobiota bacterium]